jgi:hypothetical protein
MNTVVERVNAKTEELVNPLHLLSDNHHSPLGKYNFTDMLSVLRNYTFHKTNCSIGHFADMLCNFVHMPKLDDPILRDDDLLYFLIFLESMRQQLKTGNGLRCPYWTPHEGCVCKNSFLLQMLEGIWKNTDSKSYEWRVPPCLFDKLSQPKW